MLFVALFSLVLGYLLNEEACLNRVCRNLAYAHEGWLLIKSEYGVLILVAACVLAFFKGYGSVRFLEFYFKEAWLLPAGLFFFGNVLAVSWVRGLFYSPWFALMGIMCAGKLEVFQAVLTVLTVSSLATRDVRTGIKLWQPSMCLFILLFCSLPQGIFWIMSVLAARIISGRQSPFTDRLIKYFGKILGWRVTT